MTLSTAPDTDDQGPSKRSQQFGSRLIRLIPLPDPLSGSFVSLSLAVIPDPAVANSVCPVELKADRVARRLLGALVDAAGDAICYVEIWLQRVGSQISAPTTLPKTARWNGVRDHDWIQRVDALRAAAPSEIIMTGFEGRAAPPFVLDGAQARVLLLNANREGAQWRLCDDENLLGANDLPSYATSEQRALGLQGTTNAGPEPGPTPLVLVGSGPWNDLIASSVSNPDACDELNAAAARIHVRRHRPFALHDCCALLDQCQAYSTPDAHLGSTVGRFNGAESTPKRFLLFRNDPVRCAVEAIHHKLRIWRDAVVAVERYCQTAREPHFRITDQAFAVALPDDAERHADFPLAWAARPVLTAMGGAMRFELGHESHAFLPLEHQGASAFRPLESLVGASGSAPLWVRSVEQITDGAVRVRADIGGLEEIARAHAHVVLARMTVEGNAFELLFSRRAGDREGQPVVPVEATPSELVPSQVRALQRLEGVSVPNVSFETLPACSTPIDLHALAALGVRILFGSRGDTLGDRLASIRELGARVGDLRDYASERAIQRLLQGETWARARLGPSAAFDLPSRAEEIDAAIHPELWSRVLAAIVAALPGAAPWSVCRGLSDLPDDPVAMFRPIIHRLDALSTLTARMALGDHAGDREVLACLDAAAVGVGEG